MRGLDEIKARLEAAMRINTGVSLEAVNAVSDMQDNASADMRRLIARIERLETALKEIVECEHEGRTSYKIARTALEEEDGE